jgi:8-oxo-dGTP pyrophosphatase MutT (NUDIX family)
MVARSLPYRSDRPAVAEVSSGAVIASVADGTILLLHEQREDRWCFPKGHVEPGESLLAAARRETLEETGLADLRFVEEVASVHYRFYDPARERNVIKTAVYFLALASDGEVRTEPIFDRYRWTPRAEAFRALRFPDDREALAKALRYLPPEGVGRPRP